MWEKLVYSGEISPQAPLDTGIQLAALKKEVVPPRSLEIPFPRESEWDWSIKSNPEYFHKFPNGNMPDAFRRKNAVIDKKTKTHLVDDHGLFFYKVQKGDNLWKITDKIVALNPEDFAYLEGIQDGRSSKKPWERQKAKINGFNIPAGKIQAGMWLPVPWEREDREVSEKLLLNYATIAIEQMRHHARYGPYTNVLISKIGKWNLIALMLSTAKQESGWRPIGKYEFHRWEAHQSSFSFSLFHVLMKWPWIKARKHLEMTEWQTYHPVNACKLFLGFIIEKILERGEKWFLKWVDAIAPLATGDFTNYATFYNGKAWRRTNPHYVSNMQGYFTSAKKLLSSWNAKALAEIRPPKIVT